MEVSMAEASMAEAGTDNSVPRNTNVLMKWRNNSMRTNMPIKMSRRLISASTIVGVMVVLLVVCSSQYTFAQQGQAKTFASASQAAQALDEAVRSDDDRAVRAILGAGPELTSSGDEAVDKLEREQFAEKYGEMHRLVREPDGSTVLYIGAENWPFPIPLVAKGGKWRFDADAGAREITARRIGEDESTAIQVSQDLTRATQPGSETETTGYPAFEFARTLASNNTDALQSFHGYNFRIGSEQSGGVLLVAYPADYGVSGVMTFIVVPGGFVYEKDLGSETATLAPQIKAKVAGDWTPVQ